MGGTHAPVVSGHALWSRRQARLLLAQHSQCLVTFPADRSGSHVPPLIGTGAPPTCGLLISYVFPCGGHGSTAPSSRGLMHSSVVVTRAQPPLQGGCWLLMYSPVVVTGAQPPLEGAVVYQTPERYLKLRFSSQDIK